mmetsp:Transcript_60155/g.143387  ORF Transcript_60155/g.143387 Transcript_60155/m.143387 type:complete len:747 (+) Transcript_60155:95-2335(+)|eukprot:CAMPEP_0178424162 /NCGR_PEP_ID=MMETSP0689_2-20121128/28067_1 /TAXON_ID=160604 /ORGANISM="Amphidinium massartii, Strain CS-259" /LENGTH=746 /DNA_ID=CAMNT_0020045789 /DNA_START=74 /DNA_END=2314 /DNA_ORIENTATION=+
MQSRLCLARSGLRGVLSSAAPARRTTFRPRHAGALAASAHRRLVPEVGAQRRWASSGEEFEFKAETKKLLDIVAKSLYTDKEVFIRELVSNASDACEKLRFMQATQQLQDVVDSELPLTIKLQVNESERKFVIEDTGIGMTRQELIDHLGTIAKSGSLDFSQSEGGADADKIIGQFGVGFYSTFVVADKVEVYTRTCDVSKGEPGYLWSSDGAGSFTITEVPDMQRGTRIELTLKDDAVEFARPWVVKKAAEKFSSFIDFPIYLVEEGEDKEINKQDALWMKTSATEEEHKAFFRYLSSTSYGEPYYTLLYHTDAPLSIKSCFYIPSPDNAPSRLFTRDPEVGVALHSRRVLVKKQADGIIPKWLHWVRGVVDCEDMPMNISRENMQDTRLMEKLSMAVVRRILRFLGQEAKKEPEKYAKFFGAYSYYLKAGLIEDKEGNFSRHKDDLLKLMRFESSQKDKGEILSLDEYIDSCKDGQKNIYYFCCPDRQVGMASPYMEQFNQRKRPVLLMYEDIDEFVINSIEGYKDKKFISVDSADKDFELDLDTPEEDTDKKDQRELTDTEQKELEKFIKDVLKEKVQEVKFSSRLVTSPAIVTSVLSPHMRKMMKQLMAGKENDGMNNVPVTLELSAKHHVITTLHTIKDSNEPVARMAVQQLLDNACIAAGMLDDPRTLLGHLNKVLEMFVYQGAGFDYAKNEYTSSAEDSSSSSSSSSSSATGATSEKAEAAKEEKDTPKFEEVKSSSTK